MGKKKLEFKFALALFALIVSVEITLFSKIIDKLNPDLFWLTLCFLIGFVALWYMANEISYAFRKKKKK